MSEKERRIRIGDPIDVTGYFIPWRLDEDQPQCVELNGIYFVPVFSTEAKLNESKLAQEVKFTMKQIDDGEKFLESVIPHMRVMIDPWITERGTTRWKEPMYETA
jgi:hypothetical protein